MQKQLPWDDATPLDAKEANALRDNLIEGVTAFWQGCDQLITFTNRKHAEAYIWQGIDEEDTAFLVDCLLHAAMKNKVIAAAVRGIAQTSRLWRAGAILLPKFMQSVQFYADNGGFYIGGMAA